MTYCFPLGPALNKVDVRLFSTRVCPFRHFLFNMDYDKYDAVLHYVWGRTHGDAWFKPSEENVAAGVCLRVAPGKFRLFPYENHYLAPFEAAIRQLNPLIAVKVRSAAVHAALATVSDDAPAIYIDSDTRIQILDTVAHLVRADKEQCGAFIRDERVLVAWSDDFDDIIPLCHDFQDKLMKLVWRSRQVASVSVPSGPPSIIPSSTASDVNLTAASKAKDAVAAAAVADAAAAAILAEREKPKPESSWNFTWKLKSGDPERQSSSQARPMRMFAPVYAGLGAALSLFFISCGISMMISEYRLDHEYKRFFVLVTVPFLFCVSLFFSVQIITNVSFVLGPVAQYHENSKYYSAVSPEANPGLDGRLPHVTVELPVYKESLEETIAPSIISLKKAIQTYARQGGTSSIFVHDDGLQLVPENEKEKRISFYEDHNIGWVARPPHSGDAHGYKRAGRFKKASNMNYGLALSLKMECKLKELAESGKDVYEEGLEDKALELAIEEVFQESGQRWRPWACNAKSLRMGDIILLVDSDTIVPEDCFRDAARELTECPDVAIIQHESDVMQVAHHYFENAVAHFTRRINRCISMGCANGEVAPFVGHNTFLRWSAIQDAAFIDPDDGVKKIWSESNVSEDFDMALRLQLKGYIIRWATYSNGGFKEGVSLTVDDELNRWQKYSYGCNELIFNPLKDWWHAGPITKQLRVFLWSDAPVHYKITMMSYMFSYYGIAAAAVLSLINYCLLGWALDVDGFYMHSFEIWLACTVVFPGAGNLGYTLLEYRLGKRSILSSFIENITWIPFFFFFFGGLSMHLSVALLAHLFSYNITWGATAKEVERSTFFLEVPKIWKRYWQVLVVCFLIIAGMIVMSLTLIPEEWRIPGAYWGVIFPLAIVMVSHILFPIVLNPWLMIFSY